MLIVEARMYRANFSNQWIDDITEYMIQGKVSMDTSRQSTWNMDATLTWEGWKKLDIYKDWLAPYLKVTWPDGRVREGQLGLYMVLDSPEEHEEYNARVMLEAGDPLWLVARQGFQNNLLVREGVNKIRLAKEIIDGAVLTETASGKRRYAIADKPGADFKRDREWDKDDDRLETVNDVLGGAGYLPLWTTKNGIITSMRAAEGRLKNRSPIRTYTSHVPPGTELARHELPLGRIPSELVGKIRTRPKGLDLYNEILVVNDSPSLGNRIRVKGRITHPNNPRSVYHDRGRRRVRTIRNNVLDDNATAMEVMEAFRDRLSTMNNVIEVPVLPDPQPEFARETVNCYIYNGHGEKIARGHYAVHRVDYGFTPSTATMKLTMGRIDDAYEAGGNEWSGGNETIGGIWAGLA